MNAADAWNGSATVIDSSACPICLSEMCEGHDDDAREAREQPTPGGLSDEGLSDAADVAAEGRAIAQAGVRYVVNGVIPDYGMVGMSVAFSKVGKTTFGHALGSAVATGTAFLDRDVQQKRVLNIAAEDPPEYTAYLARHLSVPRGCMTFYRRPVRLDQSGLVDISMEIAKGRYGLVLISSWQSVIAGLVKDENDNAGAVAVVERVKMAARATGVPWLIDAHSGKGEDQSDGADPTRAMRGASAAAGAADFLLSLRYAEGSFSSRRRLSGKGRFVSLEPVLLDYDMQTGTFTALGDGKSVANDTTWQLIVETGALRSWASVDAIATAIGSVGKSGRASGHARRKVRDAIHGRVESKTEIHRGQPTTLYRMPEDSV